MELYDDELKSLGTFLTSFAKLCERHELAVGSFTVWHEGNDLGVIEMNLDGTYVFRPKEGL